MKKVVALVLSLVMLLSVSALAESPKSPQAPIEVISSEPAEAGAAVDCGSDLVKALTEAIADAGMTEAFGGVIENAEEFTLLGLGEFTMTNVGDTVVIRLSVKGVKADNEVNVLLGIIVGSNVEWSVLEVVSVEDGVVTIAVTPDQAADIQAGTAVIAVLVK